MAGLAGEVHLLTPYLVPKPATTLHASEGLKGFRVQGTDRAFLQGRGLGAPRLLVPEAQQSASQLLPG